MARGGQRKGAGRPVGTGLYGAPTVNIRVPAFLEASVRSFVWAMVRANAVRPLDQQGVQHWIQALEEQAAAAPDQWES